MFCDRCGTQAEEMQSFCRACGRPLTGVVPQPGQTRVSQQVRLLGIFWLALAGIRVIPSLFLLGFGRWGWHFAPMPHFVGPLFGLIGGMLAIGTVLGFLTGVGLLTYQPWARTLALVMGVLALFDAPLGTALGIFTMWVMLSDGAAADYRRLCRPM